MKRRWFLWSAVAAGVLLLGLLSFSFLLHGSGGLFKVNGMLRLVYQILFVFGLVLVVLAWLEYRWLSRKKSFIRLIMGIFVRLMTVVALLFSFGAFYYVGDYFDAVGDIAPQLMLAEGTQTSGVSNMAVTFRTALASKNTFRWGSGDTQLGITEEAKAASSHAFFLSELQPATSYWYRVNSGGTHTFTTPPLDGNLKFAVITDAHFGKASSAVDQMTTMLETIAETKNGYQMLVSLGDLVDFGFRNQGWKEAFQVLTSTTSTIPTTLLIGNHDALFTGVNKYQAYAYPASLPLDTGTQLWHRIDNGNVHFLILDVEWSAESFTPTQQAWLKMELQRIPREDWTVVLSHGFYYSSGYITEGWKWYDNLETIAALAPIFEEYGVDMVFSGHNHILELLKKNGVTYVVCGPFGGELDSSRTYTSPASIWYSEAQHDFVGVDITGNTAEIIFHGADGSILYHYSVANQ